MHDACVWPPLNWLCIVLLSTWIPSHAFRTNWADEGFYRLAPRVVNPLKQIQVKSRVANPLNALGIVAQLNRYRLRPVYSQLLK